MSRYAPDPHGEKLLARMAEDGIDVTVMVHTDNVDLGLNDEQMLSLNRTCADIAAGSHRRIIPLAGVDPRREKAPELLRRCVEDYGMKGLKWHPDHGYYPNSKEAYAVLRVAQGLGIPLLIHTGQMTKRAKFAQPIFLDDVLQDFPGVKVIAAHMGRADWRGWAAMAQFRRNLYGDTAMWQQLAVVNYERFCGSLREILDTAGSDSVLFGSDGPGFPSLVPNRRFIQILRDLPQKAPPGTRFTSEEVDGILGANAQKVFGL
ncbi:MAG: amidohydrolase family protein [Chloroflexi bacterium]|nr:amidohydrolase family protein [Chloroflexota bacterium]